jgi:hypothetical protein
VQGIPYRLHKEFLAESGTQVQDKNKGNFKLMLEFAASSSEEYAPTGTS